MLRSRQQEVFGKEYDTNEPSSIWDHAMKLAYVLLNMPFEVRKIELNSIFRSNPSLFHGVTYIMEKLKEKACDKV